jgi:hypothetical protein
MRNSIVYETDTNHDAAAQTIIPRTPLTSRSPYLMNRGGAGAHKRTRRPANRADVKSEWPTVYALICCSVDSTCALFPRAPAGTASTGGRRTCRLRRRRTRTPRGCTRPPRGRSPSLWEAGITAMPRGRARRGRVTCRCARTLTRAPERRQSERREHGRHALRELGREGVRVRDARTVAARAHVSTFARIGRSRDPCVLDLAALR